MGPRGPRGRLWEGRVPSVAVSSPSRHTQALHASGAGTDRAFWPEQVVRRHILGSIVQSEGSYVESLKRVLQVPVQGPLGDSGDDPRGTLY